MPDRLECLRNAVDSDNKDMPFGVDGFQFPRLLDRLAWVPPAPRTMFDVRPNRPQVIQSADVYVEPNGVVYLTDYNAGFYVLQFGE